MFSNKHKTQPLVHFEIKQQHDKTNMTYIKDEELCSDSSSSFLWIFAKPNLSNSWKHSSVPTFWICCGYSNGASTTHFSFCKPRQTQFRKQTTSPKVNLQFCNIDNDLTNCFWKSLMPPLLHWFFPCCIIGTFFWVRFQSEWALYCTASLRRNHQLFSRHSTGILVSIQNGIAILKPYPKHDETIKPTHNSFKLNVKGRTSNLHSTRRYLP